MTDFKAKMHQIRFRLGLCPRPRSGSLQHSPRPPRWIWGPLRGMGEGLGWGTEWKEGGEGREGEKEGREREGPQFTVEPGPLRALLRHCLPPYRGCIMEYISLSLSLPHFGPQVWNRNVYNFKFGGSILLPCT